MYVAQYIICIAQACMVFEHEHYVMYKDQQRCEAAAAVKANELVALLKDKAVQAVAFRCVDKSGSSVWGIASFIKGNIMPMAPKTDAEKVAKLREMAKDKTLPQEVRNTYLDQAVKLEEKAATKAGVKLAKGGMAKKPAAKKMMYGGMADKTMMAKGGAVKKAKK